jgi:pantoate--beta-alanine ligase
MLLITKKEEFIDWRRKQTTSLTLVPTMGNLHKGHLSLVEKALESSKLCVVSIFVNPLQFGEGEDFDKYPKTLQEDVLKLEDIRLNSDQEIVIFAPSGPSEIFPNENKTFIEVKGLDNTLCGQHRPGHFLGVTTVVYQLFNLIKPQKAIFGQKDFQQFCIINKMTKDLGLPIEIISGEIIRSVSGLALSSRNQYLSEKDKEEALVLHQSLLLCKKAFQDKGLEAALSLLNTIKNNDHRFQYLELLDAETLTAAEEKSNKLVVAGALIMGDTRLIDNCLI